MSRPKMSLSRWSLGYLVTLAVALVLAVLAGYGDVHVPPWVAVAVWLPILLWMFGPWLFPGNWRRTDDRRPSWSKDEEADRRADALCAEQRRDKGDK